VEQDQQLGLFTEQPSFPLDAEKTGYMSDLAPAPGPVRQFLFWLYVRSCVVCSRFVQTERIAYVNLPLLGWAIPSKIWEGAQSRIWWSAWQ